MTYTAEYTVFRTKWGYFGLAGLPHALQRAHLPAEDRCAVESRLVSGLREPQLRADFFKPLQELITAYFEGARVDFNTDIPVLLDDLRPFSVSVLTACRRIKYGRTTTYARLAADIAGPNAARAAGNALARNPLPLIIPCHRVLRTDGQLGGFSAPGGEALKKRMLLLEERYSQSSTAPAQR